MKAKIFTLFLFLAVGSMAFGQYAVLNTPDAVPTIDGVIEATEWDLDNFQDLLNFSAGSTTTDVAADMQMLWDDDNLYIAVQIADATPNNDHATDYQNDCVEFFVHMTGGSIEGTENVYDASTCQLRFPRGETTHTFTGTTSFVEALNADASFEYMVVSDADGWVVEATLPLAILDAGELSTDADFMFDYQVADNTGEGRTGQLFWHTDASDNQWRWIETFGPGTLSDDVVVLGAVESLNSVSASAWVANDMLNFKNVEGQINIFSISGALVKTEVIERNGSIDIASMKAGLYIVAGDNFTAKIVK